MLPACSSSGNAGGSSGSGAAPGIVFITGSGATGASGATGSSGSSGASGDTGFVPGAVALFQINSQTYRVHQIGYIRTSGFVPALDYSGPAGCSGRIFEVNSKTVFRYTAHNAEMQEGATIFYFPSPPLVYHHTLAWHSHFFGSGESDDVSAAVYCPLPPASVAPIPESSH